MPSRVLVRVIRAIPHDLLNEISSESHKLQRFAKVPMVVLLLVASTMVGLDLIFLKFA